MFFHYVKISIFSCARSSDTNTKQPYPSAHKAVHFGLACTTTTTNPLVALQRIRQSGSVFALGKHYSSFPGWGAPVLIFVVHTSPRLTHHDFAVKRTQG